MVKKNVLLEVKRKKAKALFDSGRHGEALDALEGICQASRRDTESLFLLAGLYGRLQRYDRAVACFSRLCELRPDLPHVHFNYGIVARNSGDLATAITAFREAVRREPRNEAACESLAQTLAVAGALEEAVGVLRDIVVKWPAKAAMHNNLGSLLQTLGHLDEAVAAYRQAIARDPDFDLAYDGLGSALSGQGRLGEALAVHRQGLERRPGNWRGHSNLLMTLNYLFEIGKDEVLREHLAWAKAHGLPVLPPPVNLDRAPERRLRVGYVSADFRAHSVAFFIAPVLAAHDRARVETFCYAHMEGMDAVSERIKGLADHWHDIYRLADRQTAELIRADKIDILVDLGGHTSGNRLPVFTMQPAPVQVTYLGYPNTTGVPQIAYRITDATADPPGEDGFYSENLVRLDRCFLGYEPLADCPEVSPLPAAANGHITFGSFNNLAKMGDEVVDLWARLVREVGGARLLIKNRSLTEEATRARYYKMFEARDLGRDRVELLGHAPSQAEHLQLYSRVDIGLDTFPYNGTTTTCEALWMGVPVIALAGDRHAGRVGESLLYAIGRPEWIARDQDDYVQLAAALAGDLAGLGEARATLRGQVAGSSLCDGAAVTRALEKSYQDMWRAACLGGLS